MPRKKAAKTKKVTSKEVPVKVTKPKSSSVFEYLRFGESYTSLVLGIIAVIIATVLLLSFINARQNRLQADVAPTPVAIEAMNITPAPGQVMTGPRESTYTVAPNDSLWSIAQRVYHDGYKWVEIAKANSIVNPDTITAGQRLQLPKLALPDATVHTGENEAEVNHTERKIEPVTNGTYKVASGDDLWNIAVRVYGDGYQWVKIAQVNELENPNIIHVGNVLKIPQK